MVVVSVGQCRRLWADGKEEGAGAFTITASTNSSSSSRTEQPSNSISIYMPCWQSVVVRVVDAFLFSQASCNLPYLV